MSQNKMKTGQANINKLGEEHERDNFAVSC